MTLPHSDNPLSHDLGYILYPARRRSEPGYSRLEVFLQEIPSEAHFDAQQIDISVITPDGGMEMLEITAPWSGAPDYRACVGPIDLFDRKGKHLEIFAFGGELKIEPTSQFTRVDLTSDAPIIMPHTQASPQALLIQEVEIQLAHLRAVWSHDRDAFDECLACLEPLELYQMCLVTILDRFDKIVLRDDSIFRLSHLMEDELKALGLPTKTLMNLKA